MHVWLCSGLRRCLERGLDGGEMVLSLKIVSYFDVHRVLPEILFKSNYCDSESEKNMPNYYAVKR